MSETINLFGASGKGKHFFTDRLEMIKYQGTFDMDELYQILTKWFTDRKYDFYEALYKDKPPELELDWLAQKRVDEMYMYKIQMYFHLFDVKEVEAIKDGKKKKMIFCRMTIKIEPSVVVDYQERWSGTSFNKKLFKFYINNVIKKEIDMKVVDPLWYVSYKLHTKIKDYLGMESRGNAYG